MNNLADLSNAVTSFAVTYLLHSTILLTACGIALGILPVTSQFLIERLWKLAAVLGLVTAAFQVATDAYPFIELPRIAVLEKVQADQQYFSFRPTLEQSFQDFRESERHLRRVLGLAQSDGRLIEPGDEPTADAGKLDWNDVHAKALADAFELAQQRQVVERCQLQLEKARQDLPTPSFDLKVGDLVAGNVLPAGRRRAIGRVRNLELELARARARLQELELEVARLLSQSLEAVEATERALEGRLDRMNTEEAELNTASMTYRYGRGSLDVLLKAQCEWAQAAKDYHAAIVEHAIARKDADLHRGALLASRDVMVTGDAFGDDRK